MYRRLSLHFSGGWSMLINIRRALAVIVSKLISMYFFKSVNNCNDAKVVTSGGFIKE
jgi:hypothetical protein